MAIPSLRALLAELDQTNHAGRTSTIAKLAHEHAGERALAKLFDRLVATSDYHAYLAVVGARAAGDSARLLALADHENPRVRATALLALPLRDVTGAEFTSRYQATPLAHRRLLLRRAVNQQRRDLVTALATAPLADADRAGLLAFADETTAAQYVSDVGDLIPNLAAFASRHPETLIDELATRLDAAPALRDQAWRWVAPALPKLAAATPKLLLGLLEIAGPTGGLPEALDRSLGTLGATDASALARLLATSPRRPELTWGTAVRLPKSLRRRVRDFSAAERTLVARHYLDDEPALAAFLEAFPPAERAAIFQAAFADVHTANRTWSEVLLDVLPRELREAEAARIAALPEHAAPASQVARAAFLAPDQAQAITEPHLRDPDAASRAAAWSAYLDSAARSRDPEVLAAAFSRLDRLTNEQDPVRLVVARSLARISPELLGSLPLGPLRRFATAAVQARDTSFGTLSALQSVAWSLVREAAITGESLDEALAMLNELSGPDGLTSISTQLNLPRGSEQAIITALVPTMRAAAKHHDYRLAFSLWRALGRRAWQSGDLNDLAHLALRAPSDVLQRQAVEWLLADPDHRSERVAQLLAVDESFATLAPVQQVLCRHRQDLVEVCFRVKPLRGRFWKNKSRFVAVLPGPFRGWLPGQLADYAEALDGLVRRSGTTKANKLAAVATIGRLPGVGAEGLQPYLTNSDVLIEEAAIAALSWTDDPGRMLHKLLSYRSSDRARVALYAAGRSAMHLWPDEAARQLSEVLTDPAAKVTARKEAVRLLGRLRVAESSTALATLAESEVQVDIRLAATRTLRQYLDEDQAWAGLEAQAVAGRSAVLSLIETRPQHIAVRHRSRFALVLELAASGGDPEAIGALGAWARWAPRIVDQVSSLLASPDLVTSLAASDAVETIAASAADWTPFLNTLASLAAADAGEEGDEDGEVAEGEEPPGPEPDSALDQPARQRIDRLVWALRPPDVSTAAWHRDRLEGLAVALDGYPGLEAHAWTIRLAAIDWAAPSADLVALADRSDPLRALELGQLASSAVAEARSQGVEPALAEAADLLTARPSASGGALALALVKDAGVAAGWSQPWRDRLQALRSHPIAAVAAWAKEAYTVDC